MKNGLNSQKMKYCKKKIVRNILRNNWLKGILNVMWYNCLQHRTLRTNYEKYDEKCHDL